MNESEGDLMDKLNQYVDSLVGTHSTCGSAALRCGSATPYSLNLHLAVTFHKMT